MVLSLSSVWVDTLITSCYVKHRQQLMLITITDSNLRDMMLKLQTNTLYIGLRIADRYSKYVVFFLILAIDYKHHPL